MATTDVAKYSTSVTTIKNGNLVTAVDKLGNKQIIAPPKAYDGQTPEGIETKFTTRFDDPQYYTA